MGRTAEELHGVAPVEGFVDKEPRALEKGGQNPSDVGLIVGYQNPALGRRKVVLVWHTTSSFFLGGNRGAEPTRRVV